MKSKKKKGKVYLVGTGPGDPGLMTMKGARVLSQADVVVYDRLIPEDILGLSPQSEKIFAGKFPRKNSGENGIVRQKKINRLLADYSRRGKTVVRLKGGDPFIFGRGGEEAAHLSRLKIPYEVVPGISAGYAVPAYAGIPVTDRRFASEVIFLTGHEGDDKKQPFVDWNKIGNMGSTLVFFMGLKNIDYVVEKLLLSGKPEETKVAVIEKGTTPNQRTVEGNLADIRLKIRKAKIQSPALVVVGEVARLRKNLSWFEKQELFSASVLITRPRSQSSELKAMLEERGARVFEFPAIDILSPRNPAPLDAALKHIGEFDWIIFTSANGVQAVFERFQKLGLDARHFSPVRIAAIGTATARALKMRGITADLVPASFTTDALLAEFSKKGWVYGRQFLLPRTDIAPKFLKEQLVRLGGKVTEVTAYRTVMPSEDKTRLAKWLKNKEINFVLFTSASTVDNFFKFAGKKISKNSVKMISIGPVTSAALRKNGWKPAGEAKPHTLDGLVSALVRCHRKGK